MEIRQIRDIRGSKITVGKVYGKQRKYINKPNFEQKFGNDVHIDTNLLTMIFSP